MFGIDSAEANRLRWEWQYRKNPHRPSEGPLIWVAREAQAVIGQYATMPVKLSVEGQEIDAAYAEKYPTPGSRKWVRGFRTPRRRATTLELVPR